MKKPKKFKWVVEFQVDESWIADGFEMTDEVAFEMLSNQLGFAHYDELRAKVIKKPTGKSIRRMQRYKD